MKLFGKKLEKANTITKVFPRTDGNLVFVMESVYDFGPFEKMCPEPQPPAIRRAGSNVDQPDYDDKSYSKRFDEWSENRSYWMLMTSLSNCPGLDWDKVKKKKPDTWKFIDEELGDALTDIEINILSGAIIEVCGLSATKIEEATESFLLGAGEAPLGYISQNSELIDTLSFVPVSDLG